MAMGEGESYLCPVGSASKLLHDGLISQPVVQPRHILAIGPREERKKMVSQAITASGAVTCPNLPTDWRSGWLFLQDSTARTGT